MRAQEDQQHSLQVVVIDDEPRLLAAVTELLSDYGVAVVATATDGCQALPALVNAIDEYGRVDALILDERMPHVGGLEATRTLRRFFPTLPVILYSAYCDLLGDAPTRAGVTLQVSKGDHPLALIGAIRTVCGHAADFPGDGAVVFLPLQRTR